MKFTLYTDTELELGDKVEIKFVDTKGDGERVAMAKKVLQ